MKLGLMQPYLFPYIGYFQLIATCDVFVVFDDVQFIKRGWINRNRILVAGEPKYITLPVQKDHQVLHINERRFLPSLRSEAFSLLRQIEEAYRKAPFFDSTIGLVRQCLDLDELNVSIFVTKSLQLCCQHLGIITPFQFSSALEKDPALKAEKKVLQVNKILGASRYINPIGGADLYSKEAFNQEGIGLTFLKTQDFSYRQFDGPFVPNLSIIDVLMFNSIETTRGLLTKYDLL